MRPEIGEAEPGVLGIFVAAFEAGIHVTLLGRTRDQGDGAGHGAIAEDAGGCAAHDFDPVRFRRARSATSRSSCRRDRWRECRPTSTRRAAGARRSEAAQRHALRGGIRHQAGGAAEQAEARDAAQAVVQLGAGRLLDLRSLSMHGDVGRRFGGDVPGDRDGGLNRLQFLRLGRLLLGRAAASARSPGPSMRASCQPACAKRSGAALKTI